MIISLSENVFEGINKIVGFVADNDVVCFIHTYTYTAPPTIYIIPMVFKEIRLAVEMVINSLLLKTN